MRVLICGSRNWDDAQLIWQFLEVLADYHPDAEIVHGAARGADTIAGNAADALGLKVIAVPADWQKFGKAAGPMRNKEMLGYNPDRVLAFRSDGDSKGTDHMIRLAARAAIPVRIINPKGQFRDISPQLL